MTPQCPGMQSAESPSADSVWEPGNITQFICMFFCLCYCNKALDAVEHCAQQESNARSFVGRESKIKELVHLLSDQSTLRCLPEHSLEEAHFRSS